MPTPRKRNVRGWKVIRLIIKRIRPKKKLVKFKKLEKIRTPKQIRNRKRKNIARLKKAMSTKHEYSVGIKGMN